MGAFIGEQAQIARIANLRQAHSKEDSTVAKGNNAKKKEVKKPKKVVAAKKK